MLSHLICWVSQRTNEGLVSVLHSSELMAV